MKPSAMKYHNNIARAAPSEQMCAVLKKTAAEAKQIVTRELVKRDVALTIAEIRRALDLLRGATMIVYPMGLPPHEPIRAELEDKEDLQGTQVISSFLLLSSFYIS